MEWDLALTNLLILNNKVQTNIHCVTIVDQVGFKEALATNQHVEATSQALLLQDSVKVNLVVSRSILHSVAAVQGTQPRVDLQSSTQLLGLIQTVALESAKGVYSTLTLVDSAVAVNSKGAYDTLVMEQVATFTITRGLSIGNELVMTGKARYYEPTYFWISDPSLTVNAP